MPRKSPPLSLLMNLKRNLLRLTLKNLRVSDGAAVVVAEDAEAILMANTEAEATEVSVVVEATGIDVAVKILKLKKLMRVKRSRPRSASLKEHVAATVRVNIEAVVVAGLVEVTAKRESTGAVVAIEAAAGTVMVNTGAEAATEVVVMGDLAVAATTMVKMKMASKKSEQDKMTETEVVVAGAIEAAATEVVRDVAGIRMGTEVEAVEALVASTEARLMLRSQP